MDPKIVQLLLPSDRATLDTVVNCLQAQDYHCSGQLSAAHTRTGWHMLGIRASEMEAGRQFAPFQYLVFHECGSPRILYIAFEGKTAMFNIYDNLNHCLDRRPILRQWIEAMNEAHEMDTEQQGLFEQHDDDDEQPA